MKDQAQKLRELGPQIIALTDGDNGVYICGEESFHLEPSKNRKVVETTGAGDAFASGFVTGLVQEKSLKVAARMGLLNAESVISHFGTKTVLSAEEMKQALQGE